MSRLPVPAERLIDEFGPHLNYAPREGYPGRDEPDSVVETHCCFCGQQCGIKLQGARTTRSSASSRGTSSRSTRASSARRACKRYLQGSHPDRLLAPAGARPTRRRVPADRAGTQALDRVVARDPRHPGGARRATRSPCSRGVSLTNEKSYLLGKFARVALRHARTSTTTAASAWCRPAPATRRRSASTAPPNPWSDIPLGRRRAGSPARTSPSAFPITTQLHLAGARPRREAHRRRPAGDADRAHRRPVPAGAAGHATRRCSARMLHELIRARLARPRRSSTRHTVGLRRGRRGCRRRMTPAWAAEITGVPAGAHRAGGRAGGARRRPGMLLHARGIEQQTKGVDNVPGVHQPRCSRPASSASRAAAARRSPARATARAGASTARSATSCPGNARHHRTPSTARTSPTVWGCDESEIPGQGPHGRTRSSRRSTAARSRACSRSASTRWSRCPTPTSRARRSTSSSSSASIDFFLSETAHHADVVLPGSLHEEDEGTVDAAARAASSRSTQAVDPPGEARRDWQILCDLAERLGKGEYFAVRGDRARSSTSCASRRAGGTADYYGITWERIEREHGRLLAVPERGPPRHAAAVRGRPLLPPRRQGALPRRRRTASPARSSTTSTRSASPPAASSASTSRARRRGASARWSTSTPSRCVEMHPRAGRDARHRRRRLGHASRRGAATIDAAGAAWCATIRPDTVFIPYHWPGAQGANQLTHRALDPRRKIPEFKVSACRLEKAGGRRRPSDARDRRARERRCRRTASMTGYEFFVDPSAASAARPACRPARSATPTAASR